MMGSNEGTVEGLFGEMMGDGATSIQCLKFLTCFPILMNNDQIYLQVLVFFYRFCFVLFCFCVLEREIKRFI